MHLRPPGIGGLYSAIAKPQSTFEVKGNITLLVILYTRLSLYTILMQA